MCLQYSEYHPQYEKAKEWIAKNLSDDMRDLYIGGKLIVWHIFTIFDSGALPDIIFRERTLQSINMKISKK